MMMMMIMIASMVESIKTPIVSFRRKLLNHHDHDHDHDHGRRNAAMVQVRELIDDCVDRVDCIVCLSDVVAGEKYGMLPRCNHRFHVECVEAWLRDHSTCPLCRTPVSVLVPEDQDSYINTPKILLKKLYQSVVYLSTGALERLASWLIDPIYQDLQHSLSHSCNFM